MFLDNISMFFTSLVQGLREDFSHPIGLVPIGAIGVTYLIVWLLTRKLHHYFDKSVEKVKTRIRLFTLSPVQFAKLLEGKRCQTLNCEFKSSM
jgi:hypothetical protein